MVDIRDKYGSDLGERQDVLGSGKMERNLQKCQIHDVEHPGLEWMWGF